MGSAEDLEKMQARQSYRNVWHTDLTHSITADVSCFCLSIWCPPCTSYLLRKRALYEDMSRYICCAGYVPCSGKCGESKCPEFCLATETQHKVEMDKRDGKFGPPPVQPMHAPYPQAMSRIDQAVPPTIGYAPYPPPVYDQPPPYGQPAYGYPPKSYPPPGYPPANHP